MTTTSVQPGESLSLLSDRILGDPLRFTELLDLNPNLDVFGDLAQGSSVEIPEASQILKYAEPVFGSVSKALSDASGAIGIAEQTITDFAGKLPPQLQGYAKEALGLVGELNGAIGKAEGILTGAEGELRRYTGQAVKVVPWLLGGKR